MCHFDPVVYRAEAGGRHRLLMLGIAFNAVCAFAQCNLTGSASLSLYCNGGAIYELQDVHWSDGTPPYSGFVEFAGYGAGSFSNEYGNGWSDHVPVGFPEGQQQCGYTQLVMTDAEGCELNYAFWECNYWLNAANQFILGSVVWDDVSGTATVTLLDNPGDPGNALLYPSVDYYLYQPGIPGGTSGEPLVRVSRTERTRDHGRT